MNESFGKTHYTRSPVETAALRTQTRSYASYLRLGLMRLKKARTPLAEGAISQIYEQAHSRYRLRFQALENVVAKAEKGDITVTAALQLTDILLRVLTLLCVEVPSENTRAGLTKAFHTLERKCQSLVGQILIVYDFAWLTLNPYDHLHWVKKLAGPDPLLTCDWDEIIKPQVPAAPARVHSSSLWLTESQRECGEYLKRCFRLRTQQQAVMGYQVRPPLIVAASGAGKSTLAKWLSQELDIPLFGIDSGSWMLAGSRVEKATLVQLAEFVDANPKGIVFIDECDKFTGADHAWWACVNQELFQLIDARLPWPADRLAKFQKSFFMLAAGTWQSAFRAAGKQVGFQNAATSEPVIAAIQANLGIPEEVAFRFEQPVIMSLPTGAEFAERISAIRNELNLAPLSPSELESAVSDAVAGRRGNRWLENYVSGLLHEVEQAQPVYTEHASDDDPYPLFEF